MAQPIDPINITGSWIFQAVAGGAVGVGIMILLLAKWGKKILGGDVPVAACPYAPDHPKFQEFMGASEQDRKDMKGFLTEINGKVEKIAIRQGETVGKLDLLLQGARVRWNAGLIPDDKGKG